MFNLFKFIRARFRSGFEGDDQFPPRPRRPPNPLDKMDFPPISERRPRLKAGIIGVAITLIGGLFVNYVSAATYEAVKTGTIQFCTTVCTAACHLWTVIKSFLN